MVVANLFFQRGQLGIDIGFIMRPSVEKVTDLIANTTKSTIHVAHRILTNEVSAYQQYIDVLASMCKREASRLTIFQAKK